MMPIRIPGNCRLHCEHDKLPPPQRGPSSETRHHEVSLRLRVLSAVDLECSLPLVHKATGGRGLRHETSKLIKMLTSPSVGYEYG